MTADPRLVAATLSIADELVFLNRNLKELMNMLADQHEANLRFGENTVRQAGSVDHDEIHPQDPENDDNEQD